MWPRSQLSHEGHPCGGRQTDKNRQKQIPVQAHSLDKLSADARSQDSLQTRIKLLERDLAQARQALFSANHRVGVGGGTAAAIIAGVRAPLFPGGHESGATSALDPTASSGAAAGTAWREGTLMTHAMRTEAR